ncbi:MAG: ribonuclease P protein component [Proteobacteria bacterium]|nr:ribonuclease P protein component [Pseudomonadota bacterium]MDA1037334.1 ribonuclease P protein component [Pseudomonadota bacterium]
MSQQRLPKYFYSSKSLRLFYITSEPSGLRVSVPKKFFRLAVNRNKVKRQIKEIFRTNDLYFKKGCFVVMVYKPFCELSYREASFEIIKAVKSSLFEQ